jgi:hypothetical protein
MMGKKQSILVLGHLSSSIALKARYIKFKLRLITSIKFSSYCYILI